MGIDLAINTPSTLMWWIIVAGLVLCGAGFLGTGVAIILMQRQLNALTQWIGANHGIMMQEIIDADSRQGQFLSDHIQTGHQ